MAFTVAAWAEVLAAIPGERLNDCYKAAMAHHGSGYPLSAAEIAYVWTEKQEWIDDKVRSMPDWKKAQLKRDGLL